MGLHLRANTSPVRIALALIAARHRVVTEAVAALAEKVVCALIAGRTLPVWHALAHGASGRTPSVAIAVLTWPGEVSAVVP
jgi:hypothetical protein